jgi:hypothetical protein
MKKELAKLAGLAGQLEKLRGAIEDARRGPEVSRGLARPQRPCPPRGLQPEHLRDSCAPSSGFVEFSGAQLMDAQGGTVVELADATGVRLTMRLAAGQPLDVAAVVALFRGAQR